MSFELTIQDIPHYTYKDYELWDGDWELIKGFPYAMAPAPEWIHQEVGGTFLYLVKTAFDKNNNSCGCKVLYECDWRVSDDTVVRPDVMIVCDPIEGKYPTKPPVLTLEILSPNSILKDRNTKFNLYKAYGVKYYLIANIDKKEIEYFILQDNNYRQVYNLTEFQFSQDCIINVDLSGLFQQ
jgi:Uma2 family endonuclease